MVPGTKLFESFPGTVTRPFLVWCFSWRWLPRHDTSAQPPSLSSFSTAFTFIDPHCVGENGVSYAKSRPFAA